MGQPSTRAPHHGSRAVRLKQRGRLGEGNEGLAETQQVINRVQQVTNSGFVATFRVVTNQEQPRFLVIYQSLIKTNRCLSKISSDLTKINPDL